MGGALGFNTWKTLGYPNFPFYFIGAVIAISLALWLFQKMSGIRVFTAWKDFVWKTPVPFTDSQKQFQKYLLFIFPFLLGILFLFGYLFS